MLSSFTNTVGRGYSSFTNTLWRGITPVRNRNNNNNAEERPLNSMCKVTVKRCYLEDEEGFFATPSYIEQLWDEPMQLMGRGFRKRQNKNL